MTASTVRKGSTSKGEKLAQRLSYILALLHQGDNLDKHELAQSFGVDVRTIERDLGERLIGIAERGAEGRWQLTHRARSTVPARNLNDYARLAGIEQLFPDASLAYLLTQLQTPPDQRPTRVQPVPQEDLPLRGTIFTQLETAVAQRNECPWVSLLVHEATHVAAARVTRLQLREIRLGRGPTVYCTVLFGADTHLGTGPQRIA